jgi:hypothetical protein
MKVKDLIKILKEVPQDRELEIICPMNEDHFISEVKICAYVLHPDGMDVKTVGLEPRCVSLVIEKR